MHFCFRASTFRLDRPPIVTLRSTFDIAFPTFRDFRRTSSDPIQCSLCRAIELSSAPGERTETLENQWSIASFVGRILNAGTECRYAAPLRDPARTDTAEALSVLDCRFQLGLTVNRAASIGDQLSKTNAAHGALRRTPRRALTHSDFIF